MSMTNAQRKKAVLALIIKKAMADPKVAMPEGLGRFLKEMSDRFDQLEQKVHAAHKAQAPQSIVIERPGKDAVVNYRHIIDEVLRRMPEPPKPTAPIIDLEGIAAHVMRQIPKPAKPLEIDHEKLAEALMKGIIKGKKLKMEHIDGLSEEIAVQRNQLAGKVYGRDTLVRGGGDTVAAGSGISIATDANGKKVITSTVTGLTIIAISGTIDDSNKIFTAASEPTLLNINGSFYQKTGGNITWTYLAGTITLSSAIGTGGSIFGV